MCDEQNECYGVEWEMLKQMSQSLEFAGELIELGTLYESANREENIYTSLKDSASNNISWMIDAIHNEKIDLAVGGISVTPDRAATVDFTNIFTHEPIGN